MATLVKMEPTSRLTIGVPLTQPSATTTALTEMLTPIQGSVAEENADFMTPVTSRITVKRIAFVVFT